VRGEERVEETSINVEEKSEFDKIINQVRERENIADTHFCLPVTPTNDIFELIWLTKVAKVFKNLKERIRHPEGITLNVLVVDQLIPFYVPEAPPDEVYRVSISRLTELLRKSGIKTERRLMSVYLEDALMSEKYHRRYIPNLVVDRNFQERLEKLTAFIVKGFITPLEIMLWSLEFFMCSEWDGLGLGAHSISYVLCGEDKRYIYELCYRALRQSGMRAPKIAYWKYLFGGIGRSGSASLSKLKFELSDANRIRGYLEETLLRIGDEERRKMFLKDMVILLKDASEIFDVRSEALDSVSEMPTRITRELLKNIADGLCDIFAKARSLVKQIPLEEPKERYYDVVERCESLNNIKEFLTIISNPINLFLLKALSEHPEGLTDSELIEYLRKRRKILEGIKRRGGAKEGLKISPSLISKYTKKLEEARIIMTKDGLNYLTVKRPLIILDLSKLSRIEKLKYG